MGTITGGCGDDAGCDAIVDAEKEDGGAYGGDSDEICDCTSGDGTVGEDRFDPDRKDEAESLFLSLLVGFSSLGRRTLPLAVDTMAGEDLNADGAVDPEVDDTRESVTEVPAVPLPEADNAFDADNGVAGTISVRVEDSLDDGELVVRSLACRELSEDARERLGRGRPGSGSAGGGELNPTRLVRVEEAAAVDGDLEEFEGDGSDDDRVAVINCAEAPTAEEADKLAPTDDGEEAVVLSIRESEAARALSLDGTVTFKSWALACPAGLTGDVCAGFGTTSQDACFVLDAGVPGSSCFPPDVSGGGFKVAL